MRRQFSSGRQPVLPESLCQRFTAKAKVVWDNITIEPAQFLISFCSSLDNVSTKELQIYKSCINDFNFTRDTCDNLLDGNHTEESNAVDDEIAQFNVYMSWVDSVVPLFLSFYLGAWCDIVGRKSLMYLFLTARCLSQAMVVLNAVFIDWPKEYFLFTSSLPTTLVGGFTVWILALYAFISDISPPESRALRMALMHIANSLGRPLGAPAGAYLYDKGGFVCVTSASLLGVTLGTVLLAWNIRKYKWESERKHESFCSLFSPRVPWESIKACFARRPDHRRFYLLMFITSFLLNILPFFAEGNLGYVYVRERYDWGVDEYSNYNSINSALAIVAQSIFIPLLTMKSIRETILLIFLTIGVLGRDVMKAFATKGWMYYVATNIDILGSYSTSCIRALISTTVPKDELGKVFAMLSCMENLLPMGLSQIYATVWDLTSETFPGAFFLISAGFALMAIATLTIIHLRLGSDRLVDRLRQGEEERLQMSKKIEKERAEKEDFLYLSYI